MTDARDREPRPGRRRFLRTLGTLAAGVALAPALKLVAEDVLGDDLPRRPGTRWIGHF